MTDPFKDIPIPKITKTVEQAPPMPPVEVETGRGFWGNAGIALLVVAGIAIATKIISD